MKYCAPQLTKYGRIADFIQAGSVVATGDVTGDGVSDTLFDTDGDGSGDLVVGGANDGQTPVTEVVFQGAPTNTYDADGDGAGGIINRSGSLERLGPGGFFNEASEEDGWDEPARD